MTNNKGITLIALVITIIVLLILAGVSIAMLTGQNGILTQASTSKEKTNAAEVAERVNVELNAQLSHAMAGEAFDPKATIESNIGTLPSGYTATAEVTTGTGVVINVTGNGLDSKKAEISKDASGNWKITSTVTVK